MTTLSDTRRSQQSQYRDAVILKRWDDAADIDSTGPVYVGITRICVLHHVSARYTASKYYHNKYSVEVWFDKGKVVHPQKRWLQECLVGRLSCCADVNRPPYAGETRWVDEDKTQFEMYCGETVGWVVDPSQDFIDKLKELEP